MEAVMDHDIPPGLRFSILNRAFKRKLEDRASEMGLTAVQLQVLGELRRLEVIGDSEINQRDLENAVSVTHPTMTEIIKRLEKKGAVVCTTSRADKRYKKINTTPQYANIHIELETMDRTVFKELCQGLSDQQVEEFMKLSSVMIDNVMA
jgi:DNA-binding MarR family transcriptional regulator